MVREFAIKFLPRTEDAFVDADVYMDVLGHVVRGLNSMRNTVAPILAQRRHWSPKEVRDALKISIGPNDKGSLVVPTRIGDQHLDTHLPYVYWRYAGALLHGAAAHRSAGIELPATCANAFGQAASTAGSHDMHLHLVSRPRQRREWTTNVNLTSLGEGLLAYACRRTETRATRVELVGQVVGLSYQPPGFALQTQRGRINLTMNPGMRPKAKAAWGVDAIVTAEGQVDREGAFKSLHAIDVQLGHNPQDGSLLDVDEELRKAWASPEATEYLQLLRARR